MSVSKINYERLNQQLSGLISGEDDQIANLANCAALLWLEIHDINWIGFYLVKDGQLVLGPFQGKPACTRIPLGQGVCGTAAVMRETMIVADVHLFPGHIACDQASNSEIVVPMIVAGELIGVLDIDSPQLDRFTYHDKEGLDGLVEILVSHR
ncbi:MAG: GAF domain-containing protein [Porticoccaceae bacterium]|nr:GAF domain-containing protein [Porticoccaceae bacterium]